METNGLVKICPKCKKGGLNSRIKRGLLIKVFLFWLPLKHYKCSNCLRKTYVWAT
jgi:hypothetical protein